MQDVEYVNMHFDTEVLATDRQNIPHSALAFLAILRTF